jgi:hypothetical protein
MRNGSARNAEAGQDPELKREVDREKQDKRDDAHERESRQIEKGFTSSTDSAA